jgi:two-component sensor histidine kinase
VLATSVELTDRMRAEQDQQRLINELNHRVKNTLASVQALMVMTDRYADSKQAFVQAFSARLKALSLTHDLLTEGLWQSASLGDVIRSELEPYAAGHPERIVIEGEAVQLSPRRAISLGMVFHELATNAAKYGALSAQAGRVFVRWWKPGGNAAPALRLEWREEDGPKVAPVSRRGFGSRLIEQSITELDGTVKLEFEPSGLRCTIEIALA